MPLEPPCVADELGALFNKDAVIQVGGWVGGWRRWLGAFAQEDGSVAGLVGGKEGIWERGRRKM